MRALEFRLLRFMIQKFGALGLGADEALGY